jgi:hypothetical protein
MHKSLKLFEALILSLLAVFAPIQNLLIAIVSMVAADTLTGIIAAFKKKEPISSAKLRQSISKVFVYEVAICVGFIAETYISDYLPVVKIISAMISMVELKSIYENLNVISGSNLLSDVIVKLGSKNLERREEQKIEMEEPSETL